jgi:hypothetical protein
MRMAIVDLPLPYDPIIIDLDEPLEKQLPSSGPYLEMVREAINQPVTMVVNP